MNATKSTATLNAYTHDLRWFREHCKKHHVSRLSLDDVIVLLAAGRDAGLNQKAVNKREIVMLQAMRGAGALIALKKVDWPRTVDKQVEIYEPEELKRFFTECDQRERLVFQTFLCTGFRSREVSTLAWDDVDWKVGSLTIRPKPELDFMPKSFEERSVLIPKKLLAAMKKHRRSNPDSYLLFPTPRHPKGPNYGGDKPDAHTLETCKEIAYRAGLNCGHCRVRKGKCRKGPHCEQWYLHKWRHTFATNMLQSELDIKSLQVLLGHKNIATTEKYLKSLRLGDLRGKIERSTLAKLL